jgi:SAM-dependent methyltransferase
MVVEHGNLDARAFTKLRRFNPMFCDAAACMGQMSYELIKKANPRKKLYVTGFPYFDSLVTDKSKTEHEGTNVLIVTSPTFTRSGDETQKRFIKQLYTQAKKDLPKMNIELRSKNYLDEIPSVKSKEGPIHDILRETDIVLGTPSTTLLESMVLGIPTAMIRIPGERKQFMECSWTVSRIGDVKSVVTNMINAPSAALDLQAKRAHSMTKCLDGPAEERFCIAVKSLVNSGLPTRVREPMHPPPNTTVSIMERQQRKLAKKRSIRITEKGKSMDETSRKQYAEEQILAHKKTFSHEKDKGRIKFLKMLIGEIPEGTKSLLELGSYNGMETKHLVDAVPSVIGLEIGSEYAKKAVSRGFDVRVGDMHKLDFEDGTFDVVFANNIIEHAHTPAIVFSEIFRVLKKGGHLIAAIPLDKYGKKKSLSYHKWKANETEVGEHLHQFNAVCRVEDTSKYRIPSPASNNKIMIVKARKT